VLTSVPDGDAYFPADLLCRIRFRLNHFTAEMQPKLVGQMLKLISGNGHDFGVVPKSPTDVDLVAVKFHRQRPC
jgi:hypothetical protein